MNTLGITGLGAGVTEGSINALTGAIDINGVTGGKPSILSMWSVDKNSLRNNSHCSAASIGRYAFSTGAIDTGIGYSFVNTVVLLHDWISVSGTPVAISLPPLNGVPVGPDADE